LRPGSRRNNEQGIVIMLVAVVMLFVVGAMAALSIDVVTLYTARSEAQLAADGAALAAARVLANSGATSDPNAASDGLMTNAWNLAQAVAIQVAEQNEVGGRNLTAAEITLPPAPGGTNTNPTVTVRVQRADLPTFFARIWGTKILTVGASATAEAYNPSGASALDLDPPPPVAPTCVKPWLLPNIDPTGASASPIFDSATGAMSPGLFGQRWPSATNVNGLYSLCGGDCSGVISAPAPGGYYPGAIGTLDFPAPTQALPACSAGFNSYQLAVAGCVPRPIRCGAAATINIDVNPYSPAPARDVDTVQAASCLIHSGAAADSDSVDIAALPSPPFQFLAGNQNPVAGAVGKDVLVSDSLVTIPVIDTTSSVTPTNPVTVIGFLQVFLNPTGAVMPGPQIPVQIINLAGCGTGASGPPILGNGASPVVVRLISPP
jgi:Flp pilus assembly protein TadG